MFDHHTSPRVFGLAPGIDFPKALADGLIDRIQGQAPTALARVELFVNTRRMQRRLRDLFDAGPARLLPRIKLITDLASDAGLADLPPATSALRRRLELTQLVRHLLAREPDLAPRTALFDLADSLAALFEEMQGEGVTSDDIAGLDVSDQSGHWARALQFIQIAQNFTDQASLDGEGRQRHVVEALVAKWETTPPQHPIIIAGSTGSRGTTELLMHAVSRLPQGALVLPGFDFDQPDAVWHKMEEGLGSEDHPQYRFHKLMSALDMAPQDVHPWTFSDAPAPSRNKLVSLALRPAPVTDQWLDEGPKLPDLAGATDQITLVEAKTPREEALAIALRMRQAVEDGKSIALITPDRMLTRQVTAALDRWRILPDDSAGTPLQLTPPGRFLRHVAALWTDVVTSESLLTLLKHPLTHSGREGRGLHLLWTRELELSLRRHGPPFPTPDALRSWAAKAKQDDGRMRWAEWVGATILAPSITKEKPLTDLLAAHVKLAEQIAAGPDAEGSGGLWQEAPGRQARIAIDELRAEADASGPLSPMDYATLIRNVLNKHEVRDRDAPRPDVLIWGTLEARVHGAEMVILGGLNDGVWPELPSPDAWLNRKMRKDAGLLLPERRVGLSAHDFQQAIAAGDVWLTRSTKSDDAETVPSRWLNRLSNLLEGLEAQGGKQALKDMRVRGDTWLTMAQALERPETDQSLAARPSPRPPVSARPRRLSVTRIKTLIRDPYAIYAEYVLQLKPLDPLVPLPDAPLRGIVIHDILEQFLRSQKSEPNVLGRDTFMQIAEAVLAEQAPWPVARQLWKARLEKVVDWFLMGEEDRRQKGVFVDAELKGLVRLSDVDFSLSAKADRMDQAIDGSLLIYDYKTGAPPSPNEQLTFDKQLLLEAEMVKRGGFEKVGPQDVLAAEYIGLGSNPTVKPAPLDDEEAQEIWPRFERLILRYFNQQQGYTSRRAMARKDNAGPYDHLARFGEWDITDDPTPEDVS